jgi:hypothetical protein
MNRQVDDEAPRGESAAAIAPVARVAAAGE